MKYAIVVFTLLSASSAFASNSARRDSIPQSGYDSLVVMPAPINTTPPAYPEYARKKGIEGTVWTEVLVSAEGKVKEARVIRNETASKELEKAALAAVKQWTFKPATKEEKPVEVRVTVPFRFKLDKEEKTKKK